jgi:hypothetical protein
MKKTSLNKAVALSTAVMMVAFFAAPALTLAADNHDTISPESDDVIVNLTVNSAITLSAPADVDMTDITGDGTSTGAVTWNVRTNDSQGYKLEVNASASPAMTMNATENFADYGASTPETWALSSTDDSAFGFTASGTDSEAAFGSGTLYRGFAGTTPIQVASSDTYTADGGTDTTVGFYAEVGTTHIQPSGDYSALITATATTL